jgi:hypothetical protein
MALTTPPIDVLSGPFPANPINRGSLGSRGGIIPPVIISNRPGTPGGIADRSALVATARSPQEIQAQVLADGATIPLAYGGPVRLGAKIAVVVTNGNNLLLLAVWCRGPVDSVVAVEVDNQTSLPAGVTVLASYTGAPGQTTDTSLIAAFAAQGKTYADALPGVCYSVVQFTPGSTSGFPQLAARIKGLKVFDPRENRFTYSGALNNAAGWTQNISSIAVAAAPDGSMTAWTLTDSDAASYKSVSRNYTIPNDGASYSLSIRVKKTAGGTAPTFGVNLDLTGGTGISRKLRLNTDTGVDAGDFSVSTDKIDPSFWYCTITVTNNTSGNVTLAFGIFPATSAYGGGLTDTVAATGSAIAAWPSLNNGATVAPYTPAGSTAVVPITTWSDNPALCLADFISAAAYGAGLAVDWPTVVAAADYCDELVGAGPVEKRRLLALAIASADRQSSPEVKQWIQTLRAYAGCYTLRGNDGIRLISDRAGLSAASFTNAKIYPDTVSLTKRSLRDAPTKVIVAYTDTSLTPWRENLAVAEVAATYPRESRVPLSGITRYSQARREAIERLNHFTLEDLEIRFEANDEALSMEVGDLFDVTHPIGLSGKIFRCSSIEAGSAAGDWRITGVEYQPTVYSGLVEAAPTFIDTTLPSPSNPPLVTGLTLTEELYVEKSIGLTKSRIRATFTEPIFPFLLEYRVEVVESGQVIQTDTVPKGTPQYRTPAIQEGKTYLINVYTVSVTGAKSAAVQASKLAVGKTLPPAFPIGATFDCFEIGGEVIGSYTAAIDIDTLRYQISYGAVGGSWATSTFVDLVDAQRFRIRGVIPEGTWVVYVAAKDSVGNYSATQLSKTVTVTSDAGAFISRATFSSPTLTNLLAFVLRPDMRQRYITNVASDSVNSIFTAAMSTYTNPIATYRTAGNSKYQSESYDIGVAVSASFVADIAYTDLGGTAVIKIETSLNGSAWTTWTQSSVRTEARFVRLILESTGAFEIVGLPGITIAAVGRKESGGPTTSSASAATVITLTGKYVKAIRITVTPRGTTAREVTVNNVILSTSGTNSFEVYLFDANGTQVASDFTWDFEGV